MVANGRMTPAEAQFLNSDVQDDDDDEDDTQSEGSDSDDDDPDDPDDPDPGAFPLTLPPSLSKDAP